jgi:hypothetical protein
MEKKKFFTLLRLELRPLGRPVSRYTYCTNAALATMHMTLNYIITSTADIIAFEITVIELG